MKAIKERWISTLRYKASTYEHPARKKDAHSVTNPSLDDICNEIEAFFAGLMKG